MNLLSKSLELERIRQYQQRRWQDQWRYRHENKEHIRKYQREYRQDNKKLIEKMKNE